MKKLIYAVCALTVLSTGSAFACSADSAKRLAEQVTDVSHTLNKFKGDFARAGDIFSALTDSSAQAAFKQMAADGTTRVYSVEVTGENADKFSWTVNVSDQCEVTSSIKN